MAMQRYGGEQRRQSLPPQMVDTPDDHEFNLIVRQAAAAIGTRMALISLVNDDRQWSAAAVGINVTQTALTSFFCLQAIRGSGALSIVDASLDVHFATDPLVTGSPHIRFYAGTALCLDGVRVGALCVLDDQPRPLLSPLQTQYLTYLADRTVAAIAARVRS